jgi:serine/threonine protein kinase
MTGSLYDILENHKIRLSLPEILDISIDIMSGLEYLHGQCPVIVHRDISSKNILLDGNKAKIADLGQAKILDSSVLSRQTGMPGAMAYSAPEVLTGKYTSKIDIFSFGVLMTQMCCGEYPR